MALAVNRTGTVFKKCDRSNHRPETSKACAAGTCQHTCEPSAIEKCPHAWTLRYSVSGKQVEKSFRDKVHETTGRTLYGSGKKLAQDFQLKLTVDKRSADVTFADHGRTGKANFGEAAEAYLSHLAVKDVSREHYTDTYRKHVKPVFGDKTLVQVASDRDGVLDLLTVTMRDLSLTLRQQVRQVIVGTCDEAVKAGKIGKHNLADIRLADNGVKKARTDFVFPTYEQVKMVADGVVMDEQAPVLLMVRASAYGSCAAAVFASRKR